MEIMEAEMMKMIKVLVFVVPLLFLTGCGVYKYQFNDKQNTIISKKGNPITTVFIKNQSGKTVARFEAKKEIQSKEFSLLDFSPEYFDCKSGCPFNFIKGEIYCISVAPFGDRVLPPIIIKLSKDGKFISSQEWEEWCR